jgi:hypothetical protein
MCCERRIYVGVKKPHCPICHKPILAVSPSINNEIQYFECPNPKCVALGFLVANDGELTAAWLGKHMRRNGIKEIQNRDDNEQLDPKSVETLREKLRTWDELCRQFAEGAHKTTIELQAMSKLRDWRPKYTAGLLILNHRPPNPACWFLGDRNSSTERISVSQQEDELK